MNLDALVAWLRGLLPKPPAMPALPDFRTLAAPKGLRNVPGFANAWATALAEIQERTTTWATGAWDFLLRFNLTAVTEAIKLGLIAGLAIGFVLGLMAGMKFHSSLTTTLANRRALEK